MSTDFEGLHYQELIISINQPNSYSYDKISIIWASLPRIIISLLILMNLINKDGTVTLCNN